MKIPIKNDSKIMCGIVGFNFKNENILETATEKLKHRGPDSFGYFSDNYVSLGHRRLKILDLSENASQPMERLHYVMIFNGEIYNFKEIKNKLKEYKFYSNSDTEVAIYAFDKWKEKCLDLFNGIFAFSVYDKTEKKLFLARDRFGIKPLYYINNKDEMIFGSEIKALISFLKEKKIDIPGLNQYFTFRFTFGEKTLVDGIKSFLPGHFMVYNLENKKIEKYTRYYQNETQLRNTSDFSSIVKQLRTLVDQAVRRQMVSDVPVACLLSGGIDSSIIAALAKKYDPDLNTFSIGFDTTNELPYAKLAAEAFETNHHEFEIKKDGILEILDDFIYYMDEPVGDAGFLPIFVLSKHVKKHNSVVLSGDGADEIFCGYDRYKMYHYGMKLRKFVPFDFNIEILKRLRKIKKVNDSSSFFEVIKMFEKDELELLGLKEFNAEPYWKELYDEPLLNAEVFDIETLLPNDFFMKSDKMSSAFGLEQRIPYLDHELVEFAFSIPLKYKLKGWNEKYILKEAFKDIIPKPILKRRKHGFDVPIDYWFKNVLGEKLVDLLKNNNHNLYRTDYSYKLLEKIKKSGKKYKLNFYSAQKLWAILIFEMWYERYFMNEI